MPKAMHRLNSPKLSGATKALEAKTFVKSWVFEFVKFSGLMFNKHIPPKSANNNPEKNDKISIGRAKRSVAWAGSRLVFKIKLWL